MRKAEAIHSKTRSEGIQRHGVRAAVPVVLTGEERAAFKKQQNSHRTDPGEVRPLGSQQRTSDALGVDARGVVNRRVPEHVLLWVLMQAEGCIIMDGFYFRVLLFCANRMKTRERQGAGDGERDRDGERERETVREMRALSNASSSPHHASARAILCRKERERDGGEERCGR